jgi:hypothetical protein
MVSAVPLTLVGSIAYVVPMIAELRITLQARED